MGVDEIGVSGYTLAMQRLMILAALLLTLSPRSSLSLELAQAAFSDQERILLSGMLTDPALAQEFAAAPKADGAFMTLWRARLAAFSQAHLSTPHPPNEQARSMQAAVDPAEWAMLMAYLHYLKRDDASWKETAEFLAFRTLLNSADAGLAAGDPTNARRVAKIAQPQLKDNLTAYLNSPVTKAAVAQQAEIDAAARAAREQAETAAAQAAQARHTASAEAAAERAARAFDQSGNNAPPPPAPVAASPLLPGAPGSPAIALTKPAPGAPIPSLTAKPPTPSVSGKDDLAEFNDVQPKGAKRLKAYVVGAGALLGGLLGLLLGGPIGALIGAAVGGGGGFLAFKHFLG